MNLSSDVQPSGGRTPARPLLAVFAAAAFLVVACGGGEAGDPAGAPAGAVATYDVRGVVLDLPDSAAPQSDLLIRHEAIDDFVGIDGQVVGMDSMSMPFPVAEGVDLGDIEAGDAVAFTLEVEWEGEPPYRVSRIEPLPPSTELEYREATPPAS